MATLASTSSSSSPTPSLRSKRKSYARRFERCCCNTIIYFPLLMVYGLTSWAVWIQASIGFGPKQYGWTGTGSAILGITLYVLLNWSYTVAVFTDPGSPLTQLTSAYSIIPSESADLEEDDVSHVPMADGPKHTSLTVKSSGEMRFCKKCNTRKPDRSHHCSSCRRCVLKMDHHCPWLATCVGFKNHKPFLLFLIYVTLFCWACFWVSGTWVLAELFGQLQVADSLMPVNIILLSVLSGILGLVLTGFTSWHIYLATKGQTTVECLEKTRYVGTLRKAMRQPYGHGGSQYVGQRNRYDTREDPKGHEYAASSLTSQLRAIHANAIPGVTRPEEGLATPPRTTTPQSHLSSPAHNSLQRNLQMNEIDRERQRYNSYLDEVASSKLPHAFDHGWKRNLSHLFGESLLLAWLPICNTTGDGWNWEPSRTWLDARDQLERERSARFREDQISREERSRTNAGFGSGYANTQPTSASGSEDDDEVPLARRLGVRGGPPRSHTPSDITNTTPSHFQGHDALTKNWNDVPDELLAPSRRDPIKFGSRSSAPAKDVNIKEN